MDECSDSTHNCDTSKKCLNTWGSYECFCPEGFSENGDTCKDLDESLDQINDCAPTAECHNTIGSFEYTC